MLQSIITGLTLGVLLSLSMGPVFFATIKHSLNSGHKGGFAFAVGVSASDLTLVLISNVFTEIFRSLLAYQTPLGIGGSLMLMGLGIYTLFFKKVKINEEGLQMLPSRKRDLAKIAASGFFVNVFNPGVIAFWITTSTTFISYTIQDRTLIFGTCLSVILALDLTKVFLAEKLRTRLNLELIKKLNWLNGAILVGFGLVLLVGFLWFNTTT